MVPANHLISSIAINTSLNAILQFMRLALFYLFSVGLKSLRIVYCVGMLCRVFRFPYGHPYLSRTDACSQPLPVLRPLN